MNLITSGAFNVHPREVEPVVEALLGIAETATIGVPRPDSDAVVDPVKMHAAKPHRLSAFNRQKVGLRTECRHRFAQS